MDDETPDHPEQAAAVSPADLSSDRSQSDADQVLNAGKLDELITASENLAVASAQGLERERTARRRFRWTLGGTGAVTLILVAGIYVQLHSAADSRSQIRDCIEPTGHCYQQSQARTKDAIGTIQQVVVLAAACAPAYVALPLNERTVAIQKCIVRGLSK